MRSVPDQLEAIERDEAALQAAQSPSQGQGELGELLFADGKKQIPWPKQSVVGFVVTAAVLLLLTFRKKVGRN